MGGSLAALRRHFWPSRTETFKRLLKLENNIISTVTLWLCVKCSPLCSTWTLTAHVAVQTLNSNEIKATSDFANSELNSQ